MVPPLWYISHWSHDFGGGAYNLKLLISISSSVYERHPVRVPFLYFSSQQRRTHLYYQSQRSHHKHISQQYPTPNFTDNYDPINITAFFQYIPSTAFCDSFFTVLPNGIATHNHTESTSLNGMHPSSFSQLYCPFSIHHTHTHTHTHTLDNPKPNTAVSHRGFYSSTYLGSTPPKWGMHQSSTYGSTTHPQLYVHPLWATLHSHPPSSTLGSHTLDNLAFTSPITQNHL